jgi:hypothetical protein
VIEAGADAVVLKRAIATDLLPAIDRIRAETEAAATTELLTAMATHGEKEEST